MAVHIKSDYNQHSSKYHLPQAQYGVCRTQANFLCMVPIRRRFRIIRHQRQAALHSALFNYTPLVIRGTDKNKQLSIVKPTQNGINRNKYTFCLLKSLEPPKKFKNQPRPIEPQAGGCPQNTDTVNYTTIQINNQSFIHHTQAKLIQGFY